MLLPNEPVTLSVAQIHALNQKLTDLRHDTNNGLSLMVAAAELVRRRPEAANQMLNTLLVQPAKVSAAIAEFSREFESALHITRPG